jgi:predicted transposase YdaD
MRRDSIFYKLFAQSPTLLFELLPNPPANAEAYRTKQEAPPSSSGIIEMITTIMVYKLEALSRAEVESMLGITLQETRIYREIREEEARSLIFRQLARRVGDVPQYMHDRIETLSLEDLEFLGEALLDFSNIADLENWLVDKRSQQ